MATKNSIRLMKSVKVNPVFQNKSIIEAAHGNNVVKINSLKEAYLLAKNSPGTVVTGMPVYRAEESAEKMQSLTI